MTDEKIKNSRELEFAVFCIENVAAKLDVDAERVYNNMRFYLFIIECWKRKNFLFLWNQNL